MTFNLWSQHNKKAKEELLPNFGFRGWGDLGREDVADGKNVRKFTEIRYQPHLRSSESDEDIKKFLADVAAKCPVENTLTYGTKFVQDGFVKVD